jgi:protein-disulfide isomerase
VTAPRRTQWLLNAATGAVTVLAIIVGVLRVRAAILEPTVAAGAGSRTKTVPNWREFSRAGTRMGPINAPVTIVEFSDFQCPFCRVASGDLHDLRRWYAKDVAVVYRHLPIHKFAQPAARAAECAARTGAFEAFHDLLFAEAESIGAKRWTRFAIEVGIHDTAQFKSCMDEPSVAALVHQDSAAAAALGAEGTPTFLINNLMISGDPGFERLNEYVKAARRQSQR